MSGLKATGRRKGPTTNGTTASGRSLHGRARTGKSRTMQTVATSQVSGRAGTLVGPRRVAQIAINSKTNVRTTIDNRKPDPDNPA
jgi:hypothetical protein